MTIFLMFFIELMASRFDVFGEGDHDHDHDVEASDNSEPPKDRMRQHEKEGSDGMCYSLSYSLSL